MFGTTTSLAFAAFMAILPRLTTGSITFCTDGTCPADDTTKCPPLAVDLGTGYPECSIYSTHELLDGKGFEGAEGGGFKTFLNIEQPDPGCTVIVRSPASVDEQECGVVVGAFKNAGCVAAVLKETFLVQFCCGTGDCGAAGVSKKMIRGMNYPRGASLSGGQLRDANGAIIEPIEVGSPPNWGNGRRALHRRDCSYEAQGDLFTKPGALEVVLTNVDGGVGGSEVTISQERTVSRSTTIQAGVNIFDIVSASVSYTFEESLSDSKSKAFNIAAGQVGKLGFTPTLKCSHGIIDCGDTIESGDTCTGYREAGEIAGTYAVISTT